MPRPAARRPCQSTYPAGSTLKTLHASFPHTRAQLRPRSMLRAPGSRLPSGPGTRALEPRKRLASCVGRESNPGQLLGRQLCSPLYHQRCTARAAPRRRPRVRSSAFTPSLHRLGRLAQPCPDVLPDRSSAPPHAPAAAARRRSRAGPAQLCGSAGPTARRPPLGGALAALRLPGPRPPTHAAPPRPAGLGPSPPAGPRAHIPHRRRTPHGRHPPVPRAAPSSPASPPRGSVASPRSALSTATRQAPWPRQEALAGLWRSRTRARRRGGVARKGKGWRWSTAGRPDTRRRPAPLVGRWREEKKGPGGKRLERAATAATKKGVLPPRRGIEPRSPA